jgi:hypothetical protein
MVHEANVIVLAFAAILEPLNNLAKNRAMPQSRGRTFAETKRSTQMLIETSASDSGLTID